MSEFNKVDRALELRAIDWLQWGEFEENLVKHPDGSDMAKLTLELISKRKSAMQDLEQKLFIAVDALENIAHARMAWQLPQLTAKEALSKIKGTK